jgi:hypothetical protein
MTTSVFHYTDANGLLGILSSDSIFATDYRYLNDSTEAGSIKDLIIPIFQAEISAITPKLIEKKWLKKEYYDQHGLGADRLQAEAIYRSFTRGMDNVSPLFVASFCRHEEGSDEFKNGLLSQWRGYTRAGGFAIKFDKTKFQSLIKEKNDGYAYAFLKSDDVHYKKYEKLFDPKTYEGVAGETIYAVFESQGINVSSVTGRKDLDDTMLRFMQSAPFLKNWAFHEEGEYRIIAACLRSKHRPEEEARPSKKIKFRLKNDIIVPYIALFEDWGDVLPIKSIIVGPHPFQDRQMEAVGMALEVECYDDVEIRKSAIPYRD